MKFFPLINIAIVILLYSLICLSNHLHILAKETVFDAPLSTQKINTNKTIIIEINGNGEFKSVQEIINTVPKGIIIHVRKSLYREKVCIPEGKPNIFMRGNGKGKAAIVWSQSSTDNRESATFSVEAPHFVAFGISFKNCEIFVMADKRVKIHGSITAQNRQSDTDNSVFVFIKGQVYGIGDVYLGRAKDAYSRVVFARTDLSPTIVPLGWTNWSYAGITDNLVQAEYRCHGPGAKAGDRVPWTKQLSEQEAEKFMSIDFLDGKNWLPAWRENQSKA